MKEDEKKQTEELVNDVSVNSTLSNEKKKKHYFNLGNILQFKKSHMAIVSERSYGKTVGTLKDSLDKHLSNPEYQIAYVRRNLNQMEESYNEGILTGVINTFSKYRDLQITQKRYKVYVNGNLFIHCYATKSSEKIQAVNLPNVKRIVFDEFLQKREMGNPFRDLMDLVVTIVRDRDDYELIMLANSKKLHNVYFKGFQLNVNPSKKYNVFNERDFVVEINQKEHQTEDEIEMTKVQKLAYGTSYYDYAFLNKFEDDTEEFIKPRDDSYEKMLNIKYNSEIFGVWYNYLDNKMYLDTKFDPNLKNNLLLKTSDFNEDDGFKLLHSRNNEWWDLMQEAIINNEVYYRDTYVKSVFNEIFKLLGIKI